MTRKDKIFLVYWILATSAVGTARGLVGVTIGDTMNEETEEPWDGAGSWIDDARLTCIGDSNYGSVGKRPPSRKQADCK